MLSESNQTKNIEEEHIPMSQNTTKHVYNFVWLYICRYILLGHEGRLGDHPHRDMNNHTRKRDITLLPFKRKLLLALYRRCWVLRKRTDTACTTAVAFCTNAPTASVAPFVESGTDTIVGSVKGALGDLVHVEARTTAQTRETPHSYPKP